MLQLFYIVSEVILSILKTKLKKDKLKNNRCIKFIVVLLILPGVSMFEMGSCQICTSVQNCTSAQNCTRGQYFTKILLHEGIKLYEDKIARRHFCTKTFLHELILF